MRRFGNDVGPFPSDFKTAFQSDYSTLYKNWGTKRGKGPREWVNEFSGGFGVSNPFQPNFTVCKSEGGTANCPAEYVKEFSGLGMGTMPSMKCVLVFAVGLVVGYALHRQEILVI